MSDKALFRLIKAFFALAVITVGAGVWYYAIGRKPKIALSVPLAAKAGAAAIHEVGVGEVLLIADGKATLYATAGGAAKWSVAVADAAPAPAPTPAPVAARAAATPAPPVAQTPPPRAPDAATPKRKLAELSTAEKPDELLAKRSERRFAKLRDWAAKLNAKKATLKTELQIEAFNEEAAKYHTELTDARAEAAALQPVPAPRRVALPAPTMATTAVPPPAPAPVRAEFAPPESSDQKSEVIADGGTIFLLHGRHARLLDRGSGAVRKDIVLPGKFSRVLRGAGCVYAVGAWADDVRRVTRICTADGAAQTIVISGPRGEGRFHAKQAGQPAEPATQALRTELSACGGALLRCDVRLMERKIAERVLVHAGEASAALEKADKEAVTASGSDIALYTKAIAEDTNREETGGRERTDESTYEIILTRPFEPAVPEVRAMVHGHADVFSTRTLDLVAAGHTLLAFDHGNKKLWESTLSNFVGDPGTTGDDWKPATATAAQPFVESDGRLYFFDSAFLTALDLGGGQPAWRLPGKNFRKLQLDGLGALYASAGSPDLDMNDEPPLTLKVDAKSGKILWKVEKYQDCIVSGDSVYAVRETRDGADAVNAVFDRSKAAQCRWKLYKLSAGKGEVQWEWFQPRRPLQIEADGRKVALLFADELQVIKSIAR